MASYSLVWKRSAEKELRALPREAISRIVKLAEALREDPYPAGARRKSGPHPFRPAASLPSPSGWSGEKRRVYNDIAKEVTPFSMEWRRGTGG